MKKLLFALAISLCGCGNPTLDFTGSYSGTATYEFVCGGTTTNDPVSETFTLAQSGTTVSANAGSVGCSMSGVASGSTVTVATTTCPTLT